MKNNAYVIYVGVSKIRDAEVGDYCMKVSDKLIPKEGDDMYWVIPVDEPNTRIVCINPEYITDEDLILKNTLLMTELNNKLIEQKNIVDNEK